MALLGFIINPIAGMGGRVGLKGTDGAAREAVRLGATPVAGARALETLGELKRLLESEPRPPPIRWLTCSGTMGAQALAAAGFGPVELVHSVEGEPSAADTAAAVARLVAERVDLILFCGGDGTARDICAIAGTSTPVLGIPSGVKMHSGVFGMTPSRTAETCLRFLSGEIGLASVEILDLDEERYRRGEWCVRLHMTASTPFEPSCVQTAKAIIAGRDEADVKEDIAAQLGEEIAADPDTLFLLGPGSTVEAVARALGIEKTLLGIDAVVARRLVGKDLGERGILELIARHPRCKLVLSPIGAQGFLLGRGNQPLSPAVIRRVGSADIIVVATPAKLALTPVLRVDTGDTALDAALLARRFIPVVVGYRRTRLARIA
jgi:predicted polyphosphate/ATP-dependent NAD kinase